MQGHTDVPKQGAEHQSDFTVALKTSSKLQGEPVLEFPGIAMVLGIRVREPILKTTPRQKAALSRFLDGNGHHKIPVGLRFMPVGLFVAQQISGRLQR